MTNTIFIRYINGNIFQEIKYNDINDLIDILKLLIEQYDTDIHIQLLVNEKFLNDFDNIDSLILSNLNGYDINVVFSEKKKLYCLDIINGKYILDDKNDNYSKILKFIISHYKNKSFDIITKNTYINLLKIAIKENESILEYASKDLKNNEEFILTCINTYTKSLLNYISDDLKNNKEFILKVVKISGRALFSVNNHFKNDREIILTAINKYSNAIFYIDDNFKNDKEIILILVKKEGQMLSCTNSDLRNDEEIVLEAVRENGESLRYASDNLKDTREIVLEAVRKCGEALEFASDRLKNDKFIILLAVTTINNFYYENQYYKDDYIDFHNQDDIDEYNNSEYHNHPLTYISDIFKHDKYIVLESVKKCGYSLKFVSDEFKNDKDVVLAAVKQYKNAIRFASDTLKNDDGIKYVFRHFN